MMFLNSIPFLNDILVFVLGFVSAFIGSISGGFGLIVFPALVFLGLPPQIALGTFNLGGLGYQFGHLLKFSQFKNLGVSWKDILVLTLIAIPATTLGSLLVVGVDPSILNKLIGVILLVLVPLMFTNKHLGITENRATGIRRIGAHIAFFFTRLWNGFFTPGSGLLEAYVKMRFYGYTILQGKAVTRIPYILAGTAGVLVFVRAHLIDYRLAATLFAGMFLGGFVGMGFAIKKGDAWLKPIIGLIIMVTAIKMVFFS